VYKVVISKKALKELEQLPRNIIAKFREKFIALAQSPYQNSSVKKLVNPKSLGIDLETGYV
jgi:mRNA-degrading endonuclease RelE of RelBE toxin-antitoxin system